MYPKGTRFALVKGGQVIGVFKTYIGAVESGGRRETIIPIGMLCLFSLKSGETVLGELNKVGVSYQVLNDENEFELSEIDAWQPIGAWLSF